VSEVLAGDQFPSHMVYGENAPKHVIILLVAAGLLLAGFALWLYQDSKFVVQAPSANDVLPASSSSATPQGASIQLTLQMLPASAPTDAGNSKPICPGVYTFYFATHETVPLAERAREGIDAIVDWARHHASAKLYIEGHADSVGEDEYNVLLSYQRAKVVGSLMEKSGVAPQQVQISAIGSHGLIPGIPGHAEGNRRVNVQISNPDECRPQSE
jgi:OOP family OmpA-OmpF porin